MRRPLLPDGVTRWPDPPSVERVAERRDEVVAEVREHAGRIAYELARLQGGEYGRERFETDAGEWTVKHEAGELAFLKFDATRGPEVYVVSRKRDPEPEPLAAALADYEAFCRAFEARVADLEGVLDGVRTDFPEPVSVAPVVEERERVLGRIRETCDRMAAELDRVDSAEYGTFTARVDGTRWELKRERDRASYLRVGGEDGVYLLSQYEPPAAADLREYVPRFRRFVAAYNDHIGDLAADLAGVEL